MFSISGISDYRTPMREHKFRKASDLASSLQVGEIIEVEVLEVLGNNLAVLDIRGSAVVAEIPGPIAPGKSLQTRVEELSPKLLLVLLNSGSDSPQPAERFLRTHLSEKESLAELIPRLSRDLPPLRRIAPESGGFLEAALDRAILSPSTVKDPAYLKNWLQTSGLFLESRIARALGGGKRPDVRFDLKAILLSLAERLEGRLRGRGGENDPDVSLLSRVRTFIHNIELDQIRNVKALAEGKSAYLQIPWGMEGERGELFLRRLGEEAGGGSPKGKEGFRVCFLLALHGLGDLRIDADITGKRVALRFEAADPVSADLLRRHASRLRLRLETGDFQVTKLDFVEASEKPRADEEDEAFDFGMRDRRLIDVKA